MDAVEARLKAIASVSLQCFRSRPHKVGPAERPCALIYRGPERSGLDDFDRTLSREFMIGIQIFADGRDSDDELDDLAAAIEIAMAQDTTFGGLVLNSFLQSTDPGSVEETGSASVTRDLRLTYQITYQTQEGTPSVSV